MIKLWTYLSLFNYGGLNLAGFRQFRHILTRHNKTCRVNFWSSDRVYDIIITVAVVYGRVVTKVVVCGGIAFPNWKGEVIGEHVWVACFK